MPTRPARPLHWTDVAVVLTLAIAVRAWILPTDFWLDEIYSLEMFARPAGSLADLAFNPAFRHDNNHLLNTVVLYAFRDATNWVVFRIPPMICGVAAVFAAMKIGAARDRATALLAGVLTSASLMLVVYSTEARGYAYVLPLSLAALFVLRRYLRAPSTRDVALFTLVIAVGLLAHPSILHVYAAAVFWTGFALRANRRALVALHAGPLVVIVLWAVALARGVAVGGGDPWSWSVVGTQSLAWTFGFPAVTWIALVAAVATALLLVSDLLHDARDGRDEWLFTIAIVAGPAVFAAAVAPPFLYPRYFLISLQFLLIVVARVLGRGWQRGGASRAVAIAAGMAFLAGNAWHLIRFHADGHGHASQAIATMLHDTPAPEIVVTSPSTPVWSETPLRFYSRVFDAEGRFRSVPRAVSPNSDPPTGPFDWYVIPSEDDVVRPAQVTLPNGQRFDFVQTYRAWGPSAMFWTIYRRAN